MDKKHRIIFLLSIVIGVVVLFAGLITLFLLFYLTIPAENIEMLSARIPRTIEFLILPLYTGTIIGYVFGRISNRAEERWIKMGFRLLGALGVAVPIIFSGMYLQYTFAYQIPILPAIHYKTIWYPDPAFVTGFRILDSIISGESYLAADTIVHYILPWFVLTFAITALITRVTCSQLSEDSYSKKKIISNTARTSAVFGLIFMYVILIETIFNLHGFSQSLLTAIVSLDILLLRACIIVILIAFIITLFISHLIFCLIRFLKDDIQPEKDLDDLTEREPRSSVRIELKNYGIKLVKSPLTIIGLVAVIVPILISIFPQLVTEYTFEEAIGFYAGPFGPPSPDHPLGQTNSGRDVLALVVYGTRDSLLFGFGTVIIGLIGGLIFGLLANKFNYIGHTLIMGLMLIFYVLPGILIIMFFTRILGSTIGLLIFTTGLLLVPRFTRIIASAEFRIVPIGKKILAYVPLFIGFSIILNIALGFLGFGDPVSINFGELIAMARVQMYNAPWASFIPGLVVFLLLIGLFVLHEGLAKHSR